jgi:predicted HicB family RNase H-like nuclease
MTLNTLSYKGYTARIDFDARDDIFIGRILGVRDIISFHSETTHGLQREFEIAVDDYLADCEKQGKKRRGADWLELTSQRIR